MHNKVTDVVAALCCKLVSWIIGIDSISLLITDADDNEVISVTDDPNIDKNK